MDIPPEPVEEKEDLTALVSAMDFSLDDYLPPPPPPDDIRLKPGMRNHGDFFKGHKGREFMVSGKVRGIRGRDGGVEAYNSLEW